jgi:Zn-dependent protease
MPTGGITLFRVSGIKISADWSWFLILFLLIFTLSDSYRDVIDAEDDSLSPYLLAVASALLFFGSILLHELGHAFEARRHGIGTEGITLWMFGGVALLERDSDTPGTEFTVAAAGPLVTLLIVGLSAALASAIDGTGSFFNTLGDSGGGQSGAGALFSYLATINLLVLAFNLIPAFPLDGGRIARAIAWKVTGDRSKGTRFAATLGRGFAYLLMGFGAYLLFSGDPITGVWMVFIGFIINGSAKSASPPPR